MRVAGGERLEGFEGEAEHLPAGDRARRCRLSVSVDEGELSELRRRLNGGRRRLCSGQLDQADGEQVEGAVDVALSEHDLPSTDFLVCMCESNVFHSRSLQW